MTRMGRKQEKICYGLLIAGIYLASLVLVEGQDAKAKCESPESQTDCKSCITAHANCSWCGQVDKKSTVPTFRTRCMLREDNEALGTCGHNNSADISYPTSSTTITRDVPFTVPGPDFFKNDTDIDKTVIQLQPQDITVRLRPGHPVKVNVTFKKVIDYPLDIYYVMDLSNSMSDDLKVLQSLGTKLFGDIEQNVTENIQLGFGSFVDKVMMPFASTVDEQLRNPCAKLEGNQECAPAFGFRHQVNITNDREEFARAINATKISGNIDSPEGSFDALMQIAVCEDIKWRQGATHVILLTTDATPHLALDGKLAAILEANDMQCHMKWGYNDLLSDALVYSKSKTLDYPSVGMLKKVFTENKIHSIFAVTEEVLELYEKLRDVLGTDAYVARLEKDSSNIIPLVKATYDEIKRRLELTTTQKPDNVELSYSVLCPNSTSWKQKSLLCDNIEINDTVEFQFEIEATGCPSDGSKVDTISLKSSSLQDEVTIKLEYVCDCGCAVEQDYNSTRCTNNGNLTCGVCACDPGREGSLCQCESTKDGQDVSDQCKRDQSREIYCESNGNCECGKCECTGNYFGKFCECKTTGCGSNEQGLCGGPNNGDCKNCDDNNECKCKNGYTVSETDRTCSCHDNLCKQPADASVTCNGRGTCQCDGCVCANTTLYFGDYCETCEHPDCTGLTAQCSGDIIRKCAECLYDADYRKASDNPCPEECGNSFLTYDYVDEFFDCSKCGVTASNGNCLKCRKHSKKILNKTLQCTSVQPTTKCVASYEVKWLKSRRFMIYVRQFNKDKDCPQPVDVLKIALPIVLVILLVGIFTLLGWKLYQLRRDRRKYDQFQKRNSGKITRNLSILYKNAGSGIAYVDDLNKVTEEDMSSVDHIDKVMEARNDCS